MKSGFTKQNLGVLLLILLFINVSLILGIDSILEPTNTAVTKLSWSKNYDLELNENYTYFDFIFEYQIYNPNKIPVTFGLPYCNLAFLPNISIIFEDETLEYIPPNYIAACIVGEITVEPGITKETRECFLTIKEKGLEELPNGNYTTWVYLHSHPEVVYNETIITITDDKTIVNYGSLETVNISITVTSLLIFASITFIFTNIIKKYHKKNN